MDDYPAFTAFGPGHLGALIAIPILVSVVLLTARGLGQRNRYKLAWLVALMLVLIEISKSMMGVYSYGNSLAVSLPLHLCGITALLTAWLLWQRSYRVYEVAYFWGMGGSVPTLLTPDLVAGYPHPAYFLFFGGHGMIILGVLYASFIYGFRPTPGSIVKTIIATLALLTVIMPLNLLLDANYLYLRFKPETLTLIDFLGPWPWYIAVLFVIGVIICLVCYVPFIFVRQYDGASGK